MILSFNLLAQQKQIYNIQADAKHDLDSAISLAKQTNKHVFVQIGYNQCHWCVLMHEFYSCETEVDSLLKANYVEVLVNYSQKNKDNGVMADLNFPQRFGFPVIVILDTTGNVIHTQNTLFLEENRGYNKDLFISFLKNWNMQAIDPKNY